MQSKNFSKSLAVLMGCASLAALAPSALAQSTGVETVMVTVEHRSENSQNVPISTSTLSEESLDSIFQSGDDIKAIANHVPSLYAESSNGRLAPRFYIRGLGNTDFDLAASQPVSIIVDDVVMENVILKSTPLFDLQNVEVDRGPQGTLFGRNTTAGIIKLTSARPSQAESAYLDGNVGMLSTANVQGGYGNAITDTLSFRISGLWQHREDWINNTFTGQQAALGGYDDRAVRLQFLWEPSSDFSALLNLHGRSLDGTAAVFRANIFTKGSRGLNANYKDDTVGFDGGANNPQRYDGMGAGLTLTYDLPGVTVTSITGYETTHGASRGDIDGGNMVTGPGLIPFPSDTEDTMDYLHQFSEELRFASADAASPFFWQTGLYYFSTDYQVSTNPFFTGPTSVHQSNNSFALFGQASYKWNDLTATGGVRWTTDIKALTSSTLSFFPTSNITTPVKARGSNISWDASLAYALDSDFNVYGRAASGFRAPSIQGRDLAFGGAPSVARSETVQSFEAGFKSVLANHTLRFNADVFQYYVHDMQLTAIGGSGNSAALLNAAGGNAYGIEVDAEWVPTDNWDVTMGFSWTHTAIRDASLSVNPCGAFAGATLASLACSPLDPYNPATGKASINNNPFPQAPNFIFSTSAKYTWPLRDGSAFWAYAGGWVQGYTNFFLYESKEFQSDGNYQVDLRFGWTSPSKRYDVYAYVQNLTDQRNVQGGIDFNNLTGFVGDPRVIGVGLGFHL